MPGVEGHTQSQAIDLDHRDHRRVDRIIHNYLPSFVCTLKGLHASSSIHDLPACMVCNDLTRSPPVSLAGNAAVRGLSSSRYDLLKCLC
jgi:hypothetical protein